MPRTATAIGGSQTRGPIYVDGPTTPDLVDDFAYRGWMESGASLISADHERSVRTGDLPAQQFYASWNADTLRLLWSGADWASDGDLFIYLDSAGGGASELYNPYAGATGSIAMPPGFGAEYLIWIQDRDTATLLQWNGGSWSTVQALDASTFRFDIGADPAVTDLRLPFALLGLTTGSSLKLLAVASEEGALRLWAAAPDKNPLNSDLVTSPLAEGRDLSSYQLTQAATLGALGSGVQPNGGLLPGADLRTSITSQPEGAAVTFLGDTLLDVLVPANRLTPTSMGCPTIICRSTLAAPLGNGEEVVYTLAYANQGTEVARDVRVTASARGGLQLANSSFNLGDVGVGISSTVEIRGTIVGGSASAELAVVISDQQHGDFEWQWVQQRVLNGVPQNVAISNGDRYVRPGVTQIAGKVLGLVDVPNIEVSITALPGGTTTLTCVDPSPSDGRWSCPWDPGSLTGIDEFQLRARATDRYGNVSDWSPVKTLIADTTPPTVTLDAAVEAFLTDGYLSSNEMAWSGQVVDNHEAAGVAVCIDGLFSVECAQSALFPGSASAPWQYDLGDLFDEDGVDHTIVIYGQDAVENRSAALTRTVRIDTVAPLITITQPSLIGGAGTVTEIPPGEPVAGTVSDGSGIDQMSVLIIAADGTVVVEPTVVTNGTWFYMPSFAGAGEHSFRIQATDRAGNTRLGPALIATAPAVTYRLNVNVIGEGTVTPPGGVYAPGTEVTVTAIPAAGVLFYGWRGDLDGNESVRTVVMDGNKTVTAIFNVEPEIAPDPLTQTVQYSDGITPVTLTVTDGDSPGASLMISSTTWTTDAVHIYPGLPAQITLYLQTNNTDTVPGLATWVISGTADLPVGDYTVTFVADDGVNGEIAGEPTAIGIRVLPEDVTVRFPGGNPRSVQVPAAGSPNSGPFELRIDVKERYPDRGFAVQPGDIGRANVSMQLVPIGPGGSINPVASCTREIRDAGYDARVTLTCRFNTVPINTYAVAVTVDGQYYRGANEDVITVYDPSLGFATGGGTLNWQGTTDGISFGFGMEYNKSGKNLQGRLMVTRHFEDGTILRLKSNALDALALGTSKSPSFNWATFSGKANVYSSTTDSTEGNYTFIVYVENYGAAGDRFWLQVKDKNGVVVDQLSLAEPAASNAAGITSGDIVVPAGQVR